MRKPPVIVFINKWTGVEDTFYLSREIENNFKSIPALEQANSSGPEFKGVFIFFIPVTTFHPKVLEIDPGNKLKILKTQNLKNKLGKRMPTHCVKDRTTRGRLP
jgi:hypothetical protein